MYFVPGLQWSMLRFSWLTDQGFWSVGYGEVSLDHGDAHVEKRMDTCMHMSSQRYLDLGLFRAWGLPLRL